MYISFDGGEDINNKLHLGCSFDECGRIDITFAQSIDIMRR